MTHLPGTIDKGPGSIGIIVEPTGMIVDEEENIIFDFVDPETGMFIDPPPGQLGGIQALDSMGDFVRQSIPDIGPEAISFVPESTIPSIPAFPTCPDVVRPPNIFDPGSIGMDARPTLEMLDQRSLSFIGIGLILVFGLLNL